MVLFFNEDYTSVSDDVKADPNLLKSLKARVLQSIKYVTDQEEQRILHLILDYENVTPAQLLPEIVHYTYKQVSGLPMNQYIHGTEASGANRLVLINSMAKVALHDSTIKPFSEFSNKDK
jgi:hypothetical protein